MLSILHHQGDSRSSFGFTRKTEARGGDQGEGAKGDACAGDQDKGSCIECKTPAGLQPPAGVPLTSVQCHQFTHLKLFDFRTDLKILKLKFNPPMGGLDQSLISVGDVN